MPIDYLRAFTDPDRTDEANRRLGRSLAFVAGAANAGGFLAVGQYTSHMSGMVSTTTDALALGELGLAGAGVRLAGLSEEVLDHRCCLCREGVRNAGGRGDSGMDATGTWARVFALGYGTRRGSCRERSR